MKGAVRRRTEEGDAAVWAHLFLTRLGRKAEQIPNALVVNRLLMREEEKHSSQMKPFSIQRCSISFLGFRETANTHIILVCNNPKHKREIKAGSVSNLSVHAC